MYHLHTLHTIVTLQLFSSSVWNTRCYCMCGLIIQMCSHTDVMSIKWIITYIEDLGGQTPQSLPACDLRCKGHMYVNQNSVFPQRWDWFVKRLMCLNPLKGFCWIQAVSSQCKGGKAELCFLHWDLLTVCACDFHVLSICVVRLPWG